jgi:cytochrome c biogenesis protein CcmG, thiol:disulfide interchange protein DsbE
MSTKSDVRQMHRRCFLRICAAAAFGLTIPGWLPRSAGAAVRVGDPFPRGTLNDLKGNSFNLPADVKGKIALIHFWASWCTSCRPEMAALESLHNQHKEKAVVSCSIDVGESSETVESFVRGQKISYLVLLDPKSQFARQCGVSGIPTTYILNREGIIRFRIIGEISRDGLEKIIKTLL